MEPRPLIFPNYVHFAFLSARLLPIPCRSAGRNSCPPPSAINFRAFQPAVITCVSVGLTEPCGFGSHDCGAIGDRRCSWSSRRPSSHGMAGGRLYWGWKSRHRHGRPPVSLEVRNLIAYSQKIRPGCCPDPEIIALRMLMINQAGGVWEIPASLIYVADREPHRRLISSRKDEQNFASRSCSR